MILQFSHGFLKHFNIAIKVLLVFHGILMVLLLSDFTFQINRLALKQVSSKLEIFSVCLSVGTESSVIVNTSSQYPSP